MPVTFLVILPLVQVIEIIFGFATLLPL